MGTVRERTQSERKLSRIMKIPIVLFVACVAFIEAASLMDMTRQDCPAECCPTTTTTTTTTAATSTTTTVPSLKDDPTTKEPTTTKEPALTGLTVAEYFRDQEGQDVLLFIDNIFRFTQAGSEVSALLGRIPSAVGYQPTLATDMGSMQERITTTKKGSITSVQAIYVP